MDCSRQAASRPVTPSLPRAALLRLQAWSSPTPTRASSWTQSGGTSSTLCAGGPRNRRGCPQRAGSRQQRGRHSPSLLLPTHASCTPAGRASAVQLSPPNHSIAWLHTPATVQGRAAGCVGHLHAAAARRGRGATASAPLPLRQQVRCAGLRAPRVVLLSPAHLAR